MGWYGYGDWAPYVSVAERRRKAEQKMKALQKKGVDVQPVTIEGRKIASSFWGEGWCEHLESFSDFENRLPRGRTYVRNGSVCHMAMTKGQIDAMVSGSELYKVKVSIKTLPGKKWTAIKGRCSGQIGSLLELLQGKLSDHVMEVVTDRKEGLFPLPGEMSFQCSCPDSWQVQAHRCGALRCRGPPGHQARVAVLVGGVDHEELIAADAEQALAAATSRGKSKRLAADDLGDVFGIEIDAGNGETAADSAPPAPPAKAVPKKSPRKEGAEQAPKQEARQGQVKFGATDEFRGRMTNSHLLST